jgi:hypothetical protein
VGIALVAMWALRRVGGHEDGELKAGDEVFGIDPRSIQELRYTTAKMRVVAKRERESDAFAIQVHATDPPGDQNCRGGGDFRRLLDPIASVHVKATLSLKDREDARVQSEHAAKLEVRDNTPIDPKEFRVVMLGVPERPVFLDGPLVYEPTISADWFRRLAGGCAALTSD